jgi:hypothetical protein
MRCPACGQRKARRDCPALGQTICAMCCGTKRQSEIDCPAHCVHLAAAREHPAAVVRKQQEQDVGRLLPTIRHLTERQHQLFFLFHTAIARHTPDGFVRLTDADVAEATDAVAVTLETAARGVIYEQVPSSLPAQRLARELTTLLSEMRAEGATVYDREAAITLRAIAKGAREEGGSAGEYLARMGRLLQMNHAAAERGRETRDQDERGPERDGEPRAGRAPGAAARPGPGGGSIIIP